MSWIDTLRSYREQGYVLTTSSRGDIYAELPKKAKKATGNDGAVPVLNTGRWVDSMFRGKPGDAIEFAKFLIEKTEQHLDNTSS